MSAIEEIKKMQEQMKKSDYADKDALIALGMMLGEYKGSDEIVESTSLTEKIKKFENERKTLTGITKLDKILGGFRSNQLVVISAPTKAGKTQFCIDLARRMKNCTMFLFEESAEEVLYKYMKKGLELPHFYTPATMSDYSIDSLYRKMIEAWVKKRSKVFFIDHLHFVIEPEPKERFDLAIKRVVQELKQFAKAHGFTIFLVCHIKHSRRDEPPTTEDIRDSSFIAQYGDTVLMLWRECYKVGSEGHRLYDYTKNMLVHVALNRKINFDSDSNTGLVDLTFNTDTWEYEESDWYASFVDDERKVEHKKETRINQLQT